MFVNFREGMEERMIAVYCTHETVLLTVISSHTCFTEVKLFAIIAYKVLTRHFGQAPVAAQLEMLLSSFV